MTSWKPTHIFVLQDDTRIEVRVELRGDYVAEEENGTIWSTVMGAEALWWTSGMRKSFKPLKQVIQLPKYRGFHELSDLPVKKGDTVTIKKGVIVKQINKPPRPAGRNYKILVDHVLNGSTRDGKPETNPSVRWPGPNSYWMEVDINDLPEAQ